MKIHLVTFTDENMTIAADLCEQSARQHGVDLVWKWSKDELRKTDFYRHKKSLLDSPRGCGYWAWKPFITLDAIMCRGAEEDDIIIYSDAGVEFVNNTRYVIDRMKEEVFLFGNKWEHEHWCKGDIIQSIYPQFSGGRQAQASVLFIRNTKKAKWFIREWMEWCMNNHLIDDSPSIAPNHPEFRENRHDQAILTTLAYRDGIKLHWWPAMYNAGAFTYDKTGYTDDYPVMFHHHRMRNEQFSATDELNRHMQNYFKRKYQLAA